MRFAVLFAIQSIGFLFFSLRFGGWLWLLAWPACSFAFVSAAYFFNRPGMLTKTKSGAVSTWLSILIAPYFLMTWSVWWCVKYLSGEHAHDEIDGEFVLGRRLTFNEMPNDIECVVDLTAEFSEPTAIRKNFRYVLYPILDGHEPPQLEPFQCFARELAESEERLFIHCAQGHGRTGMLAVALLLERGSSDSVEQALNMLQACRPKLRVNSAQRRFLDRYFEQRT